MKQIVPTNPDIALAYQKAGGRKKVQESLDVTKATLTDWLRQGYVPVKSCPDLEKLSGVSRRKLNPNFDWGPVHAPRAAKAKRAELAGV